MPRKLVRWCIVGAWLLAALSWPLCALAHDEMVSASHVEVSDRAIVWKVDVGLDGLRKAISLPDGELDEVSLAERRGVIGAFLLGGLTVTADGRTLAGETLRVDPIYEPSIVTGSPRVTRALVKMAFTAPASIHTAKARVGFFSSLTSGHRAVIVVARGGTSIETALVGPTSLDLALEPSASGWWTPVPAFVGWGIRHIFSGYDHIAFLLCLLLATARFREVIHIVTAFTLAHSVTLLLSALRILSLPVRWTESMIAASIVYVALENLVGERQKPHRWRLAFAFGLIHGLGFASDLRERLAESAQVLLPVVSFNVGIELGQLAIVLLALPLLALVRQSINATDDAPARVLRLGSLPILCLGVYWLVERGFG